MSRALRAVAGAIVASAALAPGAMAHPGDPRYRSTLRTGTPDIPGVKVQVLGYDNQLELRNQSSKTVTVLGYDGEPYARVLSDGSVEVNTRSPAYYLNEDRFATTKVPASANAKATPAWKVEDKTGRVIWHDHRMHWMAHTIPQQVHDKTKKTKVFDYAIPISVGSRRDAVRGTLYWAGQPKGFPIAALVSLIVLAALGVGVVVVVRARRAPSRREAGPTAQEAW
jgi:hypothetical protein